MKLLYLTPLYPAYIRSFYEARPDLATASYGEQMAAFDQHAFAWVGAWPGALAPHGVEVREILCNVPALQRAWAAERNAALAAGADLDAITVAQVAEYGPDVLFFDHADGALLRRIRQAAPGLRLTIGWVGGTVPESEVPRELDLVLSCAPESVQWLRARGYRSELLQHAFNDKVLPFVAERPKRHDLAFFGQIVTHSAFHRNREITFERLIDAGLALEIFSPSYEFGRRDDWRALKRIGAWHAARGLQAAGLPVSAIARLPWIGPAASWRHKPARPVSAKLRPRLRPALFGLDMYQAIAESRGVLNVHADASTAFASNMRLFETTGVGGCLVTDWKENLKDLFEPDREIVTFKSIEECVEKSAWLLAHPAEAASIGRAAKARTGREHSFARRAEVLHGYIRAALR
ncbi:MAG: glycosyltransferase [Burkholderiales bacterium]